MKNFKFKLAILSLIYIALPKLEAQSNTLTTGGNASSSSGSVSYSIGQIDYLSASGTTGNINQGLQQPYEFFIITGTHEEGIHLNIRAYPNPADLFILLEIDHDNLSSLTYQLFNTQAQLLEVKNIRSKNTLIDLRSMTNGTYFLKIVRNTNEIKTFKIIKNQ